MTCRISQKFIGRQFLAIYILIFSVLIHSFTVYFHVNLNKFSLGNAAND